MSPVSVARLSTTDRRISREPMETASESSTRVQAVLYRCGNCDETFSTLCAANLHSTDTSHWDLLQQEIKNRNVGDAHHVEWLQGKQAMEYRCKGEQDTWHFCRKCSKWPQSNFDAISFQHPLANFELCKECIGLNHQDECGALPPGFF
jgi:hypothetical protein